MPDSMAEAAGREPDPQAQARRVYEQHQAAGASLSGAALARQVSPNATAAASWLSFAARRKAQPVATATAQRGTSRQGPCVATSEERQRIQAAARRYVREQAPTPPVAILERVARIVLQTRTLTGRQAGPANPQPSASIQRSVQAPAEG
jgi:hypothetical protein